jgi:2-oxoglutarate dehydrogenase E2 component (dihydrolipoamide succinyltransferase)
MEIRVPELGESIVEATVGRWSKSAGEAVAIDDVLVELETDKVTVEVSAQAAGTLAEIAAPEGSTVEVGGLLGVIAEGAPEAIAKAPGEAPPATVKEAPPATAKEAPPATEMPLSPAVRRLIDEHALDPAGIEGTGKGGRIAKGDVLAHLAQADKALPAAAAPPSPSSPPPEPAAREERVRLSRLRRRIAERLKEAQNTAAMLTTFNEADMSRVMALRAEHRDAFEKKHGVRLGFMSFFIKACIVALKEIPAVNAEIDGDELVYKNRYDIGVAVGTERGLVVPVIRDADRLSFADIEKRINELAGKARDGRLVLDDLAGGTFTITNGGIYGSLLSTPILNPPQSGILGMHKIQPRPVAVGEAVEVRPMMYLALTYDHRIVDGREAVTFLVRVKACLEEPQRLLFDL